MTIQAKTSTMAHATPESTVVELNRVITQAEELLKTLGEEGGAAAEAVRQRVVRTVNQANVRGSRMPASVCAARRTTRRGSPTPTCTTIHGRRLRTARPSVRPWRCSPPRSCVANSGVE